MLAKIGICAVAMASFMFPAHAHDASQYVHRGLYVKAEVGLIKECVRQMWGGNDGNVPLDAWEPIARICTQIVRESRN